MKLNEAADIARPLGVKKSADTLKSYEYSDIGLGWCIHCGYTVEHERGERPVVQIVKLELNTGNHVFPLSLRDLPGDDLTLIEELIADEVEADAQAAAESLADRSDYGDWLNDQRKDREALK